MATRLRVDPKTPKADTEQPSGRATFVLEFHGPRFKVGD